MLFQASALFDSLNVERVKYLADGSGEFTRRMGMLVKKDNLGFILRSWRRVALIDNKVIKRLWI